MDGSEKSGESEGRFVGLVEGIWDGYTVVAGALDGIRDGLVVDEIGE